jgi:hypothetical protein
VEVVVEVVVQEQAQEQEVEVLEVLESLQVHLLDRILFPL